MLMLNQFPNNFVTAYAATSFAEDFAETLTEFVLTAELPAADETMRTDKIRFLWTLPELVLMRDDFRARL